ncbi:translation elongation factor Ts [Paracrocinitomix mangrovi]|uniref:translation elongation factor Ts n=1 Tax=Paracrocinitomix mangrovi TaxID=2862509 RepID=UPI001C8D1D51|nr:translation elongation factor Ts [Paracrocinitomix mangrovi]UKN03848.1 translation elongation factor Ts [Paracrocinitomix mangrovi]
MKITASQVNALRQKTGAGMMDCKKALVEANGDEQAAIDILRKKGQKVAAKRGENETKEGLVIAKVTNGEGVILSLSCETDFVAKNEDFYALVDSLVNCAANSSAQTADDLLNEKFDDKLTVGEKITEQIGVIGEKLEISNFDRVKAEAVVAYNHPGNQIASIVGLNKAGDVAEDAGRQVAMQVAAMAPLALNKDGIDQETIDREIEVGKELAIQEGKPAEMAEKIAMGRLNKFFKENTLLSQDFIKDNKMSVEQFLNQSENGLTVTEFKRVALK